MAGAPPVDIQELIDRQDVSPFQIRVLVLCALAVMFDGFNTQMIGYVAPAIARDLHLNHTALSPVFASGLIGLMIGALTFGVVADKIGRRVIIIAGAIFFGVFSLVTAMATSVTSLLVLRFLTGLGLGGVMPNAIALTSEFCPKRFRGTGVMIMFCDFPIGATIGGFAAAPLIPRFGWQGVFILGGLLPILLAPVLIVLLPESIRHLVLQGNKVEQVAALMRRINPKLNFETDTAFVIREQHAPGLAVAHLFRQRRAFPTLLLWTVFFMSLLDLFLLASWLPTVFHDAGVTLSLSVIATALFQGRGVISTLALGPIVDHFGVYRVLPLIYLIGAISIALLGPVHSIAVIMLCTFCAGIGIVGGQTGINVLAAAFYPTFIRSTGVGWALGIGRIGSIVGPVLVGIMLSAKWPLTTIFLAAAGPAVCGSLAIYLMGKTQPAAAAESHLRELSPSVVPE